MSHARTWTDEQLVAAVAHQRSWRGVARALGLKGTSANVLRTLKRHAARLDLDASHFTRGRSWSVHELSQAVEGASSWADVVRALDLADCTEVRTRLKGHAVRAGLDITHLNVRARRMPDESLREVANLEMLRVAAEPIAIAWFRLHEASVAVPVGHEQYDLLVTLPSGVKRVQVKSGTRRPQYGTYVISVGRRPYRLDKTAGRSPYDPDEIDYYFVVVGDGGLYFIPAEVVAGMTAISVGAYEKYRVGDASSLITAVA